MRDTFIELLRQEAVHNPNILLLTGDLGFGVLNKYRETLPRQFLNVGIAEQNMTGMAAGLALEGYKVFTYSIGNFCSLRCLEQVRNDVCYHQADVKIISVGSGLGYGSLGMSHHATEDVAILGALPYMKVYSPSDYAEVEVVVKDLIHIKGPAYVRLAKIKVDPTSKREAKLNQCNAVGNVSHCPTVMLTHGSSVELAKSIIEALSIPCDLYTIAQLKPLPEENLKHILKECTHIITLEEHNLCGGFGSMIGAFLADHDINLPLIRLGLPDSFIPVGGSASELCDYAGLNVSQCVQVVKKRMHL